MPVRSDHGRLYIVDTEAVWKEHMRAMRWERTSRWLAAAVVALVLGLLAGLVP